MSNKPDPRFLSFKDLSELPPPKWLIEGLFEDESLVMLAGPSGSFKSFLLIDWLLCMAVGRQWNGRKTVKCKVAYALGEGKSSLLKRIQAWIKYNELSDAEMNELQTNFRVTFDVPQLASKASVDNMLADIEQEGFAPDVIAVDTFARSLVGLDENDAKDTGLWIEQADRLRQLGYAVLFLHHTKKNTEFGIQYRGSSAIIGAMDTGMTLARTENTCTLTITKQKDHDEGAPMRFRRVMVGMGSAADSCVLVQERGIDDRFSEEAVERERQIDEHVAELLEDGDYESDRARARELAARTGLTESAAQGRIKRAVRR